MHPPVNVATTSTPYEAQASLSNIFNHSTTVTACSAPVNAMNLIPAASYSSIALTGASVPGTVFAPALLPQQQSPQQHQAPNQPLVFSGGSGNFFLAQPASVAGTPVMLAQGQSAPPGAFVVTQSLSAPTSIASTPTQQQASCIIRLPDGRLVMPAHPSSPMGLSGARMSGGQPSYFPVLPAALSSGQNMSIPQQPQLHHPVGAIAPTPGQAFFIQVPTAPGGFAGTVFATTATSNTTASSQAPQIASCVGPAPVQNRHPILVSSPLPTLQSTGVISTRGANSVAHSRPTCLLISSAPICLPDTRALQSQSKTCSMDNCVTLINNTLPVTTAFSGSGIAVTRLPNGMYTTVPYCRPQSLVSIDSPISSRSETFPATPSSPATTVRKCSSSRSTPRPGSGPSAASNVLHRLDEQITTLQSVCNPSEAQATHLKQLIDVRQQLSRTTKTEVPGHRTASLGLSSTNTDVPISPAARRDILTILGRNNLLPRINATTSSETFVVEFRLNQHRYQMRLTRQQKVDMERLLFSVNPERQAEILTVLQQEQARTNNTRVILPNPSAPQPVTPAAGSFLPNSGPNLHPLSVRAPPHAQPCTSVPSHAIHSTAFGSPSALRLVAPRPAAPGNNALVHSAPVPMCSTAPVLGVVTALAMPPIAAHGSVFPPAIGGTVSVCNSALPPISCSAPSAGGLFLSPPLPHGAQTFIMQQPFVVPSTSMTPAMLPVCCGDSSQSSSQILDTSTAPQSPHLSTTSLSVAQPIRRVFTPPKQALRLSRMRAYLVNDLKSSVERPPRLDLESGASVSLPAPLQLLEALAPYHVHQDADNTDEALLKVDRIIDDASTCLIERKRRVTDAIHAYWFRDSMFQLEPSLEDRVLVNRMMLELDRDVFETEKKEFEAALRLLSPADTDQACDGGLKDTASIVSTTCTRNAIVTSTCQTAISTSLGQQPTGQRRPREVPYLKHPSSSLPHPWSTLLGPLAYLRPRVFDHNGNASLSPFSFPELSDGTLEFESSDASVSTAVHNEGGVLPVSGTYSTVITGSSDYFSICRPSPNESDVKEDSSEDAEADLFLGLGTRASRTCANDCIMLDVTGLLEDGVVGTTGALRARTRSIAFDETYDLWQELMREEGIEMDEMRSASLDICLDGSSLDKNCKPPRQTMDNGPNDQVVEIQHSEDPDLDAAIRSILSPSN